MVTTLSSSSNTAVDPLTLAIAPALDETMEQRLLREQGETEACRISEEIDERIKQDKVAFKKWQRAVKILLLGQSESGKSTTIKNFQMKYAYDAWVKERVSWRTVIHLNLVKSVTIILDVLGREMDDSKSLSHPRNQASTSQIHQDTNEGSYWFDFIEKHKILRLRLQPLVRIRKDLERRLGSASIDELDSSSGVFFTSYTDQDATFEPNPRRPTEFFVTTQQGWKSILDRALPCKKDNLEDIVEVIAGCGSDIKELWADPVVRAVLKKHEIHLEHASGFFLDDVDRLTARDYEPSDDDIIRARLRTMGVQEYHFSFTSSTSLGQDWIMYDVGGTRSSISAWYPYFEGINSIIFLAPINCFDQWLVEDDKVNRLQDSIMLWKSVCSSKLLADVQMILFLNKADLLEEKLKSGIKFKDYVLNYREGENTVKAVSTYLKHQFKTSLGQTSPGKVFYCFLTTVIDRKAMSKTLGLVSDGIIRNALKGAEFL